MNYALMEEGLVTNLIWLYSGNAGDFPGAVPLGDRPVQIGDSYQDGVFLREGSPVLTPLEESELALQRADEEILELAYQNVLLGLGFGI